MTLDSTEEALSARRGALETAPRSRATRCAPPCRLPGGSFDRDPMSALDAVCLELWRQGLGASAAFERG